ncbi:MAG: 3'-5' exonuclease [Acidobacteria bacterium]|nr:3'-5' exonuclease [Acidobacteriota bacterium]
MPNDGAAAHSTPLYTVISTAERFSSMLESLIPAPRLAIDIEADSLYHYFEKVCLIQISTDQDTYILDPLGIPEVAELAPLMANPSVEKVFHAATYDVFCLRRDFGFVFANIFDTHAAAQLLGYEFLGLGALMEQILGIHHSKRRQRDDWSHRPLASEQLEYAAMDTHHLLRLRDELENALREKGRLSWALEEFETAAAAERPEKEFDTEGFRRIKGSRNLSPQDQVVLRALYLLRDKIARKMDVPPFKVLNNSVLIELVRRPPASPHDLFNRPGISYRVARRFAADILKTISDARRQNPFFLEVPARNNWKPASRSAKLRLEALKQWRQEKARQLNLPLGVVFPANVLENLALAPSAGPEDLLSIPGMRRWRVREFGDELIELLHTEQPPPEPPGD